MFELRADHAPGVASSAARGPDQPLPDARPALEGAARLQGRPNGHPAAQVHPPSRRHDRSLPRRPSAVHRRFRASALGSHRDGPIEQGAAWNPSPHAGDRHASGPIRDRAADLLRRGPVQLDHRRADDLGFLVDADVGGARILLVDDTLTTGARVQSAASALQLAGGRVVAAVVVGRVIRPEWSKEGAALWRAARSRRFSFETCCLERDAPPEPPFDLDA